jgi:pimeloyl-ACP methyl ester carboxylesterase
MGWLGAALVYSGAAVVGARLYQSQRTSAAEATHPPVGRFLEADGATFHYVDIGEGPPIVLLHGIGQTLDDWFVSGVVDALLPMHRIIAIDRPGYGYSKAKGDWTPERQAGAIARLLHRLGADGAVVVGHGFGVLPAIALALRHPRFARALVLVGGIYLPGSPVGRYGRVVPSVPVLGPLARGILTPAIARAAMPALVRALFEPQPVPRTFEERFSIDFATRPAQLKAMAFDLGETDAATRRLAPRYAALGLPVTVVAGSGDAIVDPDRQSRVFAGLVPNGRILVVPAGGHMVHHTSPARIAAAILDTAAGRSHSPRAMPARWAARRRRHPAAAAGPADDRADDPVPSSRSGRRSATH